MRLWTISFFIGILLLQFFSVLPDLKICLGIFLFLVIALMGLRKYQLIRKIVCGISLGFCWIVVFAHWKNGFVLPENVEGKNVLIQGVIASIPEAGLHGTGFLFKTSEFSNTKQHALIKLTWINNSIPLHVGQEWKLTVRLKKVYGEMNPGGYDYEANAYQNGIRAHGYVVEKVRQHYLQHQLVSYHWYHYPLDQLREKLKAKISANLPPSVTSQWIPALAIGERENISPDDWQVLRNTGTNHLMAIAGLHIGFMAALAHFFTQWLWRRSTRLMLLLPAVHAGAIAALSIALIYGALAGFSLPTQRACLMLCVFLLGVLFRRKMSLSQAWFVALFVTLLFNPLLILAESFWLSFASVALIFFGMSGRLFPKGLWWKWGRVQWVITIGLIPFSIWLFQEFSITSFLANSIAIPWVEFLLVPLCFFGCLSLLFSVQLGGFILTVADKLLGILWVVLKFFANFPHAVWHQSIPQAWIFLAAVFAIILFLSPKDMPGKYFSFIYFFPLLLFVPISPQKNSISFTLLDVGQGLASVVQTQNHVLVFDTGPKLSPSYDMGESVVAPFLLTLHVKKIDMLVVSHKDNDHIGGAYALIKNFPVTEIRTSVPEKFVKADYCLRGAKWQWDGVNFEFLYPTQANLNLDNDSSCVLKISTRTKSILLTGDIEKYSEGKLTKNNYSDLATNILVAPHHGSKTSIRNEFVDAVQPKIVLFAIGYRNRYHFPHPSVVKKYTELPAAMFNTAESGAIHFLITDNDISSPNLYRVIHKKYWNN